MPDDPAVASNNLSARHGDVTVFSGICLEVDAGEVVAIVGSSGAGKSTLLSCLGGMTRPAAGFVAVDGIRLDSLRPRKRDHLRRDRVGFVFQGGDLVPELTIEENVGLPLRLQGFDAAAARSKASEAMALLGIDHLADRPVTSVSGGELQRAAIARAVVHAPSVVLADEPTGALDEGNADIVFDLLLSAARDTGAAVVVVTHNTRLSQRADRTLRLESGRLAS